MFKSLIRSVRRSIRRSASVVTARKTLTPVDYAEQGGPVLAADPTDVYADNEMPTPEEIEAAATSYAKAQDQARVADRRKRAARKLLDRLPAGAYGRWIITRVESNRQVADLDEIRRIFKENNLGVVPMKSLAPSLRLERMAAPEQAENGPVLAAA